MSKGVGFYNKKWFAIKEDKDLIAESIIRILLTKRGERVMRPDFGSGVNNLIFSLMTPDSLQELAIQIHSAIQNNERRVTVVDVQTEMIEDTAVRIRVFVEMIPGRLEEFTFRFTL